MSRVGRLFSMSDFVGENHRHKGGKWHRRNRRAVAEGEADVGDTTRLGSEWRGGSNTLRLKQQNHTTYSRNQNTQEFVISLIHRHFVEHSFIRKKEKTIVTVCPRGANIFVITPLRKRLRLSLFG